MNLINKKYKILMLSDHALSTSGVGCQSRFLIDGLIKKGCWSFRQFGAAVKHENYNTVFISEDFIIKPIDGFGNRELILSTLVSEKPDLLLIFTDPRFFTWLYEIEDEVRKVCPIAYWHVWDNLPAPTFNRYIYEATDLINCHSYLTYEMVKSMFPDKTNFIPHALPEELFFKLPKQEIEKYRQQILGSEKKDDFILFWVNRNAKRKRSSDVIWSWSKFVEKAKNINGEKFKATLLMHTDPNDVEGPNLLAVAEHFGVSDSIIWSNNRIEFEKMNILHNISDACLNISFAEGFGLATLEAMQCGKPIIATKTGGLTRQVVDHRDGSENGVALSVDFQSIVGSQSLPFIYEDYSSIDTISDGIMKLYLMSKEDRDNLGEKARQYVMSEFNYQKTVDRWHETLLDLLKNYDTIKDNRWSIEEVKV